MKKISVIIAAYNAEEYLSETLDSIFLQTMNDSEYEVIIINDGSSDSTLDILNCYKQTYSNLIIIDKENGGPSSARNAGLDIAKGEYVFFFDADDILEGDALSTMYETASEKQADLLIGKYDIFNRHTTIAIHNLDDLIELEEIDKYNTDILWTFSLSNKLFRRDLIEKFNLRLPPVSYSEDGAFLTQFLYRSSKIVGLDYIIFHYRRYDDMNSITASISPSKIRDYITAHQIILASAEESFLRDYPEYNTIEEAREQNSDIHNYLNTIIQKQLQIMLNQFYIQFWSLDSDTVQLLVDEINNKLKILDMRVISTLSLSFPEFSLYDIKASQEDVLKNAFFTAVLYGDLANKDNFIKSLDSLEKQNLIFMKIVVPSSMKTDIEKEGMLQGNLFFEDSNSKEELFVSALNNTQTPYITFCDAEIIYATGIFRFAYRQLIKQQYDFISEGIYHKEYEQPQPLLLSKIAYTSLRNGRKNNPCLSMDATLANKFFCVDFVRKLHLDFGKELPELIKLCYMEGYYLYRLDGMLLYNNRETTFIDYIATEKTLPFIKEYLKDKPITLNSPEILYAPAESGKKFRLLPDKTEEDQAWNKKAASFQKKPLKNQVLFVSPRADGHLEGNAKALYPFIKGKKVICAKRLPHDPETALEMTEVILTSKVIVTDDYVKYLRYFPLRPEQRVIQLWHACGAFKKFGQRGTNMSLPEDRATHAQYNLVCVSGENLRSIYADAFDVNYNKVKALGCPRTDDYFNKRLINKTKRKIYFRHPSLIGKSVIVYAPTFRDVGCDRSEFHPELDFDRLSKDLLPNQILLICPHPVMKNDILPKKYKNIRVMRDFSTNDYMLISDMLITDYSSVIFEYALLRKPIAFFCYDLPTYDRGFYLNYPEDLPGDIYTNQDELTDYLTHPEKHILTDKMNSFVEKYMSACDGHSCERIAALINSYMEGK
ncbi:bifunctional glycosyltransferase/CDP-glycerol:glycerophosphate glycerophosphotransferase [Anaerobutyricum hallii]|nr:CDP-glycerol glycerophosphotransferase family protein [Anaerobutyricum hallii]